MNAREASEIVTFDAVVIGAGPAGQKAAIQFAKTGCRTLLIERAQAMGGECVHRGTIPSKTLRETALYLVGLRSRSDLLIGESIRTDIEVDSLMRRQNVVRYEHERLIGAQLDRNGVTLWRARARFLSPHELEATGVDGTRRTVRAPIVVIATGSRPRTPANVPVDHEAILDSDSILSLIYLPESLTVLGGGVIACEFATTFTALGVPVTMIDKADRPLAFLDPEMTSVFVGELERRGGRFLARRSIERVETDGVRVVTTLAGGETVISQKLLCALGRVAQVHGLGLEDAGLAVTPQGHIGVDARYRTAVPHVYAAGDVIGPPSLAATAMEQGRSAARHALGLPMDARAATLPVGIYTIPEIASVGLTEQQANEKHGNPVVGRARFDELARGQINGATRGLLKLIGDPQGGLIGAHIVGEGATELIHVAQMALASSLPTSTFIENIFNFPTMAEAYRVAAIDIEGQLAARESKAA